MPRTRVPRAEPDPPPPEGGPPGLADDPGHPHAIVSDLAVPTDLARVAADPAPSGPPGPP
jgi:hypothetical protein